MVFSKRNRFISSLVFLCCWKKRLRWMVGRTTLTLRLEISASAKHEGNLSLIMSMTMIIH